MITISIIINYLILSYILTIMFCNILFELKTKIKNKHLKILISKLYCFKCLSFWLTLICTGNIFIAAQVSLLAIIIEKIKERI